MIVDQLKTYLHFDRIDTEQQIAVKAKTFFNKWKAFTITHLSHNENADLLKALRYTEWYELESLWGIWEDLIT